MLPAASQRLCRLLPGFMALLPSAEGSLPACQGLLPIAPWVLQLCRAQAEEGRVLHLPMGSCQPGEAEWCPPLPDTLDGLAPSWLGSHHTCPSLVSAQAAPRVARPILGPQPFRQSSPQNRQWDPVPGSTTPRPQEQGPASQSHILWSSSASSRGNPAQGRVPGGEGSAIPSSWDTCSWRGGAPWPSRCSCQRGRQAQSLSTQGRVLQALRCQRPAPHTACRRCGRPASQLCPVAAAGSATAAWAAWRPW